MHNSTSHHLWNVVCSWIFWNPCLWTLQCPLRCKLWRGFRYCRGFEAFHQQSFPVSFTEQAFSVQFDTSKLAKRASLYTCLLAPAKIFRHLRTPSLSSHCFYAFVPFCSFALLFVSVELLSPPSGLFLFLDNCLLVLGRVMNSGNS